jgi:hypothetical protein
MFVGNPQYIWWFAVTKSFFFIRIFDLKVNENRSFIIIALLSIVAALFSLPSSLLLSISSSSSFSSFSSFHYFPSSLFSIEFIHLEIIVLNHLYNAVLSLVTCKFNFLNSFFKSSIHNLSMLIDFNSPFNFFFCYNFSSDTHKIESHSWFHARKCHSSQKCYIISQHKST